MSRRKFEMYHYRQIINQMRLGQSDRQISKNKLAGRRKVQQIRSIATREHWLDSAVSLPGDEAITAMIEGKAVIRADQTISYCEPYAAEIATWVEQGVSSVVIHRALIRKYQFKASYCSVIRYVSKLKDQHKIKKASCVLEFAPGDAAQVDFGKGSDLIDENGVVHKTWIFLMTLCFSRHQYVEIVLHQDVETWLGCHRRAFEFFAGVPKKIIIDNAKCAITKACYYDPEVQRAYAEFAEGYQFIISPCPVREPKKKGIVESGVKYATKNFLPLQEYKTLGEGNQLLRAWILEEAGNRIHGTTGKRPLSVFMEIERHLLTPLPQNPPELAAWAKVKVHGDCHVQYQKSRYSVPYHYVHQSLWLRACETTVRIYHQHQCIAIHPRLRGQRVRSSKAEHLPPNAAAYLMRDPTWCREQASAIGEYCERLIEVLFADRVLDLLRAAQGIIGLAKTYGKERLNLACKRALHFNTCKYQSVKQILKQGLDYEPVGAIKAFDLLGSAYRQGKYCREIRTIH